MKPRTLKGVDVELKRTGKAKKTLQKDLRRILIEIGRDGGIGAPENGRVKCNPNLRLLRETKKSLDILVKLEKELNAERVLLAVTVTESQDEYSLG